MMDIKTSIQPKKTFKVVSVLLGILVAYSVYWIISIEAKGRQGLTTHTQWKHIIQDHPYERKETDLRSPCPMLNTLANHGFIARDGRNIKSDDLFNALMLMGAPPIVTVGFLKYAYTTFSEPSPVSFFSQFSGSDGLDLDRLKIHNIIEHDVSLTRQDTALDPAGLPQPDYIQRMSRLAKYKHHQHIFTRQDENDARKLRWLESIRDNPWVHLSLFHQFASSTECSLLMDIIGRDGQLAVSHLESILLHERFPSDWYPRETSMSLVEVATKPLLCWMGLYQSKITLDILNKI
ncbi:Chloroperoxidase [Gilbertella persicaria]|uniref:Chloroperoxidase n=1 Tax=Gilbertella persicaria TaxID=101096 RepID=UPI00221FE647|nr:Chloroperoxidase [Gilbertella persicaria]KAI8047709.1 Chloroperoxidase [Gilbertella persicaria]